jgi:hypothetical protein
MIWKRGVANAVILPTGQVLVIGGATHDYVSMGYPSPGPTSWQPVKVPELYNPVGDSWVSMNPQSSDRVYHSLALLLPDGRVVSAGGEDGLLHGWPQPFTSDAEIFSPPYLFTGPRPTISSVSPTVISYGAPFVVLGSTSLAHPIAKVVLLRPASVTHSFDFEQRYVSLAFGGTTNGSFNLMVTAPPNWNIAPRGYYMLFVVTNSGIPSVAQFVRLI